MGPHESATFLQKLQGKSIVIRTKLQPIDWEKIFTNATSHRGLIFKIYEELRKLDTLKPNNPIKNGVHKLGSGGARL